MLEGLCMSAWTTTTTVVPSDGAKKENSTCKVDVCLSIKASVDLSDEFLYKNA